MYHTLKECYQKYSENILLAYQNRNDIIFMKSKFSIKNCPKQNFPELNNIFPISNHTNMSQFLTLNHIHKENLRKFH